MTRHIPANATATDRPNPNAPYACAECGHLHYEGNGVWSECTTCDCRGQHHCDEAR